MREIGDHRMWKRPPGCCIVFQMFLVSLLTAAFPKPLSTPHPSLSSGDLPPPSGEKAKPPREVVSMPLHSSTNDCHRPLNLSSLSVTKGTCLLLYEAESSISRVYPEASGPRNLSTHHSFALLHLRSLCF